MTAPHAHAKEAAAGTAGAAATTGVYQAGGYQMKLAAQRKGAKAPAGVSRSKYEKTIKEHQRAHGAYHGGEPTWLGAKGKLGHKVGLVTGQGPTAHVNAARHWPTKIEGASVPGAKIRRVMGYTHGGKTGLAVGATTAALGAGAAVGAEHHHLKKAASDRDMRTRVIRRGPYTKQNRKQLRHHMGVGAGVGGAVGVAGGAHLGAYIHSSAVKQMMSRPGTTFAKLPSRGKVALAVAGGLGAVGALQGASVGHDVARMQRHQAKRAMPKTKAAITKVTKRDRPSQNERHHLLAIARAGQPKREPGHSAVEQWGSAARRPWGPDDEPAQIKLARRTHYKHNQMTHIEHFDRTGKLTRVERVEPPKVSLARKEPKPKRKVSLRKKPGTTMSKAEPLAIAGKLWRKPTLRSEFTRAFGGTRKGEKLVTRAHNTPKVTHGRDAYGYPKKTWTGETHGPEVKAGFRAYAAREASNSPHRTSFKAGAASARAVTAAGKRPEYAISVPAVGAGAGLIHHEVKGKKKGTAVAKSAFGVEISKDRTKKGAVIGGAAGVAGSQATLHYKVHRMAGPAFHDQSFGRKVAAHGRVAPKLARSMVSSRSRVALAGNIATGAVAGALIGRQRDKVAAQSDAMAKSAFGVVEKNAFTSGINAVKGFKSGVTGAVGAERTAAGVAGKAAGAATMGKLKPVGAAMTKTKARTATTAGLGGIGLGLSANKNA